jgi:hypothetical protein
MEKLLSGSAWKIRLNEIESYSRAAKFEGTDTAYKRLISVAKLFDCEFDFLVEINASHIVEQVVDIKKKHGDQTPKHIFVNDYDLKSVKVDGSIEDLVTALDVRGSDTDGIIAGYDDNGKPRYQWIKWAHDNDLTDTFQGDTNWIGLKWWQETPDKTNESGDYTWVKYPIKDPIKDPWGKYTWIKFADSSTEGISDNAYGKRRIGIRNDNDSPTPSNNYGDYEWWFINEPNMNKWFVNLRDVEYKDDDGYFSPKGSYYLYSKTGKQRWQRFQGSNDPSLPDTSGYIWGLFEYDTDNRKELFNRALAELKRLEVPSIIYEAEIDEFYGREGDTVRIAQHDAVEPLYLESRVAVTKVSYTDPSKNSATIGDAKLLESNLTDQLKQAIDALNKKVLNTYSWTVYADRQDGKGISLFPDKKVWMGVAENKPTKQPDLSDPTIFKWSRVQGADGVGVESAVVTYQIGDSGIQSPTDTWVAEPPAPAAGKYLWTKTVTKYTDGKETTGYGVSRYGEDGKTAYVHTGYSWSADGSERFTTTYPGENLLTNVTKAPNGTLQNGFERSVRNNTKDEMYIMPGDGFFNTLKPRITYTAEAEFKTDKLTKRTMNIFFVTKSGNHAYLAQEPLTTEWVHKKLTFQIPETTAETGYWRFDLNEPPPNEEVDDVTMYARFAQVKIGSGGEVFTTPPAEDYANAYPPYTGTLTDFNPAASQNYKDYTWARTVGPGAYTYTAWADNITGTVGFVTDEALGKNKKYRGIYNKNVDIPDRNDPAQYRWDWTPSPDELVSTIDWQAKTSQYDMALEPDNITASVTTSKSWSKFKQDEIDTKAGKADLERTEHTLTNVGNMLEATQKQVGAMQIQSDKFEVSLKETTQAVTDQGVYVYEMLNYMQFAADGLTIGQGNSPFKMKLTNEKLAFLQDGVELARFSGRELQVKTVRVEQDLFLGNHRVKADTTSGQTIIYWVGGADE